MSWKVQNKGLYARLRDKIGATELALDKQITRLAGSKSLTPAEALFVLAKKNNLQFTREFAKLSYDSQNRITSASTIVAPARAKATPMQRKITTISLKTPLGNISDPYLPQSIFNEAIEMSKNAYPYLYILENSVRQFISLNLNKLYGDKWWEQKIQGSKALNEIEAKVAKRMTGEEKYSYHSKRGVGPIYYIDFDDLIAIMRAYEKDFNPLFKNLSGKLSGMLNKLEEITPSRNVVAHHNPLSITDNNRVYGYLHDWQKQLEYIKNQGLL